MMEEAAQKDKARTKRIVTLESVKKVQSSHPRAYETQWLKHLPQRADYAFQPQEV